MDGLKMGALKTDYLKNRGGVVNKKMEYRIKPKPRIELKKEGLRKS